MTLQALFDTTINLLARQGKAHAYTKILLDNYKNIIVAFDIFDPPSRGSNKAILLDIYEMRGRLEKDRESDPHVFGYDTLLPALRQTKLEFICISSFMTEIGTFLIFSDFDRKELIGCLLSKTSLQKTKDRINKHEKYVESKGLETQYEYSVNNYIFINGQLQSNDFV